ncbi:MAG TPA: alpha/beta fold hydrolase [Blastocatellia bacterium]|nr:alpha/beta fold hydrolase [Blastocatellia bacterium]
MILRSINLFALLFALLLIPIVAQDSPLRTAIRQFEANQFAEAKTALEQLQRAEPNNATAAFYLGRIAFQQNNWDEAERWFEAAIKLDDKASAHHHWLAQTYAKKAQKASLVTRASLAGKVRDALLKAVAADGNNLEARADLARYYFEVPAMMGGDEDKALAQIEIIKQKNALQGWLLAAELFAGKRKNAEAERAYLEAEKHQGDSFDATYKLGVFYQNSKDFDQAFAAFDKLLKAQPDHRMALFHLGRTAGMSGKNLTRGLAALDAINNKIGQDERELRIGWYWWRGNIYEAMGERGKAREIYETLERISPNHPATREALERTKPTAATNVKRSAGAVTITASSFSSFDGEVVGCEAGRLFVPENRQKPNSRLLELAFIRLKSTAPNPQPPVIFLSGGPGSSGIQTGRLADYFQAIKAIRAHADVILLDQRGTGASTPDLTCPGTFGELPATALRSREDALKAFTSLTQKCADKMRAQGLDFDGYTILESADDIEDLRKALKATKVSLWGHSYGTQLAFATLRRHEVHIERVIVMSVEGVESTEKWPSDVDRYFAELAALCKNDPRLQMPDLLATMRTALTRLDREPMKVAVVNPADSSKRELIVGGFGVRLLVLQTIMNNTRSLPVIPLLFASLAKGDTNVLAEMLNAVQGAAMPRADWFLIDGASGATAARRAQIQREAKDSLLGDVNFLLTDLQPVWQPKDLGDAFRQPVKSKVPTLFISGTLDANTPPHRAEEVRQGFASSVHVVIENSGHQDALRAPGIIETIAAFVAGKSIEQKKFALPAVEFVALPGAK